MRITRTLFPTGIIAEPPSFPFELFYRDVHSFDSYTCMDEGRFGFPCNPPISICRIDRVEEHDFVFSGLPIVALFETF